MWFVGPCKTVEPNIIGMNGLYMFSAGDRRSPATGNRRHGGRSSKYNWCNDAIWFHHNLLIFEPLRGMSSPSFVVEKKIWKNIYQKTFSKSDDKFWKTPGLTLLWGRLLWHSLLVVCDLLLVRNTLFCQMWYDHVVNKILCGAWSLRSIKRIYYMVINENVNRLESIIIKSIAIHDGRKLVCPGFSNGEINDIIVHANW